MMDIAERLRTECGHDSFSVDGCINCEAADGIEYLRAQLARAVRDIERLGEHSATIAGCHVCNTVRSYGFDPESLREEVGAGRTAT